MFPTLTYADSLEEAAVAADAMLVLTEWDEFRASDPLALGAMVERRVIIDARNCLASDGLASGGLVVHRATRVVERCRH